MLGLSDRNMGRKRMKSSPSGLSFPLGVMGRQWTQDVFTTGDKNKNKTFITLSRGADPQRPAEV